MRAAITSGLFSTPAMELQVLIRPISHSIPRHLTIILGRAISRSKALQPICSFTSPQSPSQPHLRFLPPQALWDCAVGEFVRRAADETETPELAPGQKTSAVGRRRGYPPVLIGRALRNHLHLDCRDVFKLERRLQLVGQRPACRPRYD